MTWYVTYFLRKQELRFHGRYPYTKLIGLYEGFLYNLFRILYNINYLCVNKKIFKLFKKFRMKYFIIRYYKEKIDLERLNPDVEGDAGEVIEEEIQEIIEDDKLADIKFYKFDVDRVKDMSALRPGEEFIKK